MPLDDRHIETRPHRHGPVVTYQVFADDFNAIEVEAKNIGTDLQFAIFWLSEAITSTCALPSIPATSPIVRNVFMIALFFGYGFGSYLAWRSHKQGNSLKKLMGRIRSNQIPEFGEAGKELRLTDLANLPGQAVQPVEPPAAMATATVPAPTISGTEPDGGMGVTTP